MSEQTQGTQVERLQESLRFFVEERDYFYREMQLGYESNRNLSKQYDRVRGMYEVRNREYYDLKEKLAIAQRALTDIASNTVVPWIKGEIENTLRKIREEQT